MGFDPEVVRKLVTVGVPLVVLWFLTGITVAVLYHLSLYYLDGEYRDKTELSLDLLVGILRGLAYVVAWPAIFYFDRTALFRIRNALPLHGPEAQVRG